MNPMKDTRIVVSGIGAVSAAGFGRRTLFETIVGAHSGIHEITLLDTEEGGAETAAEVPPFDVADYALTPKTYLDRTADIGFAAMKLVVEDAGMNPAAMGDTGRTGLAIGTAVGDQATAETFFEGLLAKGPRFVKPLLFPHAYSNTAASLLAIEYGLHGVHWNFANGFTAGSSAIVAACDAIRLGKADAVFAGGIEALSDTLYKGFTATGMLSQPGPGGEAERCAPFDRTRNGFVLGEGGALALFESEDHARHRKAHMYAEVAGIGQAAAPRRGPSADAVRRAMQKALDAASLTGGRIDMILAHANGSIESDGCEAEAIGALCPEIPMSSVKP
ncbi:MAG: hypothetical protein K9N51_05250, partial [Candidatus Pacebacteria bacterium]|nr:hypothetical protein [Candidatus Paceibacterota bacterium]